MDDRIAISRLRQGDLAGLEALVNRYQAPAVHAPYLILYDRSVAEDDCPFPCSAIGRHRSSMNGNSFIIQWDDGLPQLLPEFYTK